MGREAVAQRMQRHALPDPGRIGSLMKQAVELPISVKDWVCVPPGLG